MSNFYYCNDCKKPVDLKGINTDEWIAKACKECGSRNWNAMIDSPGGEPKECLPSGLIIRLDEDQIKQIVDEVIKEIRLKE